MKWVPAWGRLYSTHKHLIEIDGLWVLLVGRLFTPDFEDPSGSGKKKKMLKVIYFSDITLLSHIPSG